MNRSDGFLSRSFFVLIQGCLLGTVAPAFAGEAENYYVANVEALVQGKCIACHRTGGQAASSGVDLLFTSSAVDNHRGFDAYVNTPSKGAKANRVLSKITGALGHGGGRVIAPGSANYDAFSQYIELVSADDEPPNSAIHRVALEEPVATQAHTGVGNLRGWAVATEGITKVTILIDGVYAFDAPYGGSRGDVGGAFPDVPNATDSGFSLAFNYSSLQAGAHTITAVAHTPAGATKESSADFQVVRFDSQFITGDDAVNLSNATCLLAADQISIVDAAVDGAILDLLLKWRTAEQGFEIVEIR
ncbi:Ig-like domain-containing protein [Luminiphilus sp.]|nr:Ig-like domain-containing protein [Luminiphilus sp.]